MKLACPVCGGDVPEQLIDLVTESAICVRCQKEFDCKEWIEADLITPDALQQSPPGTWFERFADGFKVGVSMRSGRCLLFLPAACFFSAQLLFFAWGTRHFDSQMKWILFLLFVPFGLFAAFLWLVGLMSVCGRIEVDVRGDDGTVFTGVGRIGWKHPFGWHQVKSIRMSNSYSRNRPTRQQIWIETDKTITFGRGLRADRLRFMFVALRLMQREWLKR